MKIENVGYVFILTTLLMGCGGMLQSLREEDDRDRRVSRAPITGGIYQDRGYLDETETVPVVRATTEMDSTNVTKKTKRVRRDDFQDQGKEDGSLWSSDGQTNYFLTKNKIHNRGDLITIVSDDNFVRDLADEIKRTLTEDEIDEEMSLNKMALTGTIASTPKSEEKPPSDATGEEAKPKGDLADKKDVKAAETPAEKAKTNVSYGQLDLRPSLEFKSGDPWMAEVVQRYPNGNYKLRGLKTIRLRGRPKRVELVAVAKATDISDDDQISTRKVYEYRIQTVEDI